MSLTNQFFDKSYFQQIIFATHPIFVKNIFFGQIIFFDKSYFRQIILQPENNPMLMGRESENVIGHHQRSFKWREAAIEWNLDWKDLNWADSPRKIF